MSDTPRVDALARESMNSKDPRAVLDSLVALAQQLERELAAMTTLNRLHVAQLNVRAPQTDTK